jgi:hypothetical protein
LGFRASDLIEVGLRYGDAATRRAAASWPSGARGGPDVYLLRNDPERFTVETWVTPASVTTAEVLAARRWWSSDRLAEAASHSTNRPRAAAAGRVGDRNPGAVD